MANPNNSSNQQQSAESANQSLLEYLEGTDPRLPNPTIFPENVSNTAATTTTGNEAVDVSEPSAGTDSQHSASPAASLPREPGDGQERTRPPPPPAPAPAPVTIASAEAAESPFVPDSQQGQQLSPPRPPAQRWKPNRELLDQITALGFSPVSGEKALFYTSNSSADAAVSWILDNPQAADENKPLDLEGFSSGEVSDSSDTAERIADQLAAGVQLAEGEMAYGSVHKMVFVVNHSLKMGLGKIGAQVGHATLGLYRNLLEKDESSAPALSLWYDTGESKIVLKGENAEHLTTIQSKARSAGLATFAVHDAGRTQIAAGSLTVVSIFGPSHRIDSITGSLPLME